MRFFSLLSVLLLLWAPAFSQVDSLNGFRNAEWGMRFDDLKAASRLRVNSQLDARDGVLHAETEVYSIRSLDYQATFIFSPDDSTLTKVMVTPAREDPPQVQYDLLYGVLTERFGRTPDREQRNRPGTKQQSSVWLFPATRVTLTWNASPQTAAAPLSVTYARRARSVTERR